MNPIAYRVRGTLIALRREQSDLIRIVRGDTNNTYKRGSRMTEVNPTPAACATCPAHNAGNLQRLGVDMDNWDYVIALAGNQRGQELPSSTP